MTFLELAKARRSVRVFQPKPVDEQTIADILEAANLAPSAGNLQAYDIYVVHSEAVRRKLAAAALGQDFLIQAPAALVFCANPARNTKYGGRGAMLYCVQDATVACTFAMLRIAEIGLAAVWVGAFEDEAVRRAIGAPEGMRPVAILPVGYAGESPQFPGRRALAEHVHHVGRRREYNTPNRCAAGRLGNRAQEPRGGSDGERGTRMPEIPVENGAPVETEPERVLELIQVLSRFSAVELAAATRKLGFLMMAPAGCRCNWTQLPVLQDPVLTYDRAAEKLTVEMTVKGKFQPQGLGRGVNKCRCEVDVYRVDQGRWKIAHDDASGVQWKDSRFVCIGGPEPEQDFECKHSVDLHLDNIEIQGAQLRILLEVYWEVEGCGQSFGGDRVYRRCDITLQRRPNQRNLVFERVFVDNAFSETVPAP